MFPRLLANTDEFSFPRLIGPLLLLSLSNRTGVYLVRPVRPEITVVGVAESEALNKSVDSLHKDYDIVLIDGTPNLSKMATRIILTSDLLLIPIRPGAQDYRTMQEFINRYNDAKEFKSNIPAYFILNEYSAQKNVHEGILKMISDSFALPVLKTKINSRVRNECDNYCITNTTM